MKKYKLYSWQYFKEDGNYDRFPNYYDAGTELFNLDILDDCGTVGTEPIRRSIAHFYYPNSW